MGLIQKLRRRQKKETPKYAPAVPPGDSEGDFRAWQRARANADSGERVASHEATKRTAQLPKGALRYILDMHPAPDGGRWDAQKIEDATDCAMHRELWTALVEGRARWLPRYAKRLSPGMGLPEGVWHRPQWWWERTYAAWKRGEDVEHKLQQDFDPSPWRAGRLVVDWDYYAPPLGRYEDPNNEGNGTLYVPTETVKHAFPPWTLCAVDEAAELLQIPEAEVEEMLNTGELQGGQADDGRQGVNLHSVLDRAA